MKTKDKALWILELQTEPDVKNVSSGKPQSSHSQHQQR